jgi:phosphocarrier protein HPr
MSKTEKRPNGTAGRTFPGGVNLHARPAALLVKLAQRFESDIVLECDRKRASAKSILSVLTLCADEGMNLKITAEGNDAAEAVEAVSELFAVFREETRLEMATRKAPPVTCFAQAG